MDGTTLDAELERIAQQRAGTARWRLWGPYLADRQWGTVREDYSADGEAWNYLTHEQARSRAYRWGEDGLFGICDEHARLCFALALWNERDGILKERLFGLTNSEGNHGEDVKELYYYLDATPSHAYLKGLYKYPQRAFPYAELLTENQRRGKLDPEYELLDTPAFADDRYFDIYIEYAKHTPDDMRIAIRAINRGPDSARLHLLPQLWFRNRWSFRGGSERPVVYADDGALVAEESELGRYRLYCEAASELLFTDNDSNTPKLWPAVPPAAPGSAYKDAFHDYLVSGVQSALRNDARGTKAAHHVTIELAGHAEYTLRLRLTAAELSDPFRDFDGALERARAEADAFYAGLQRDLPDPEARSIQRQALAGMLWSKQFFHYDVRHWLHGDPLQPAPPPERRALRNSDWVHLSSSDVISMPDTWEYPWFAAWDLGFQCVALALVDPDFAKDQLVLLTREWYMHPNGQLPAYEWAFGDANPPVHAWAALKVYELDAQRRGVKDRVFLERVFHKLMLNFTWWVNRKDAQGRNLFQGGFLGLDNIGPFDRSLTLPHGQRLDQADATSWMAMYALNLMRIALELSAANSAYQDIASKFFEHFLQIAEAMGDVVGRGSGLWHHGDEFFYDVMVHSDGRTQPIAVRSIVGLIPLFAVETLEPEHLTDAPEFAERIRWLFEYRPELACLVSRWNEPGRGDRRLLALLRGHRMKRVLRRMLDEQEFLSPYGIRSLSKYHAANPYEFSRAEARASVRYEPAESESQLFGGNSNWRGPIWFPINYLIIDALQRFHRYYGPEFQVECPTGSGQLMSLAGVADELARRLAAIFLPGPDGTRPVFGDCERLQRDPLFKDQLWFFEYFHGDTGRGLGASHQTGWTGLIADLLRTRT